MIQAWALNYRWRLAGILVLISCCALGADIPADADASGFMDTILNKINTQNRMSIAVFKNAAQYLFAGLVTLELAFDSGVRMLKDGGPRQLIAMLLIRIMIMLLWSHLINEPDWVRQIIEQAEQLGIAAGKLDPKVILTPSQIAGKGISYFSLIMEKLKDNKFSFTDPKIILYALIVLGIGLIMIILFVLIGVMYFITKLEASFVLTVGILMLGFIGSRWTREWGKSFIAYIVAVSMKIIVTLMIIGLIQSFTTEWIERIKLHTAVEQLVNSVMYVMLSALVLFILIMTIPRIVASVVSGVSTAGLGGSTFTNGAMKAAGQAMVAGVATYGRGVIGALGSSGGSDSYPSGGGTGGGATPLSSTTDTQPMAPSASQPSAPRH